MTPEERAEAVLCAAVDALEFRGDPRVGLKLAARIAVAIRAAVEAEREECAKVCQEHADEAAADIAELKKELGAAFDQNSYGAGYDDGERATAAALATEIRERKP